MRGSVQGATGPLYSRALVAGIVVTVFLVPVVAVRSSSPWLAGLETLAVCIAVMAATLGLVRRRSR
jgi:hypothetical protein